MDDEDFKYFKQLKHDLIRRGEVFFDGEFPGEPASLGVDGGDTGVTWKRPKEIAGDPVFLIQGETRFDLDKGHTGNCGFVQAAATLITYNRKLFERVCPLDQTFEDGNYAGIFQFNFWLNGRWRHITIDDRLPVDGHGNLLFASNNEQPHEFWVPLLEKAYAKLKTSYVSMSSDCYQDALHAMTGGVSEVINIREHFTAAQDIFNTINISQRMLSILTVCIPIHSPAEGDEMRLPNGLYKEHVYSITGQLEQVKDTTVHLVRLRKPSGLDDWEGAWSLKSSEWKALHRRERKTIGLIAKRDGEFWISCEDILKNFDMLTLSHLPPDRLMKEVADDMKLQPWTVTTFEGAWVKGVSAGGPWHSIEESAYWTNPQFHIQLLQAEEDGLCSIITHLSTPRLIGGRDIRLFQMRSDINDDELQGEHLDSRSLVMCSQTKALNLGDGWQSCLRLRVTPGPYVLMPSAGDAGDESTFLLRVFTNHLPGTVRLISTI